MSQRTTFEYAQCFRARSQSFFQEVWGRAIRVDAMIGNAEDTQYAALQSVPEFASASTLMCFFHFLYNVKKKFGTSRAHCEESS